MTEAEHKSTLAKIIDAYNWVESRLLHDHYFSIQVICGNPTIYFGTSDGVKIRESLAGTGCVVTKKSDGSCYHCETEHDGQKINWWEWKKPTPKDETTEIL
jgi:hypothetical protein